MTRLVIDGCAIATVDADATEHDDGHIVVRDGLIAEVGAGPAERQDGDTRIDGRGMLATPGLVNCHHHLYQWATRGLAQEATLFEWLQALYPVWAQVDEEIERAAARAGLAALARSGCSTVSDHHYVFPREAGDLLAVEIEAAREVGLRFHPCRGSMDLGRSDGGLPPDEVVEDRDAILASSQDAIDRYHDPAPDAMVLIALAPCSPFSVTKELMRESAALARDRGVRLHTHMAETKDEERFCLELFGCRPVEYLEQLGVARRRRLARPLRRPRRERGPAVRGELRGLASPIARARTRGSAPASRPCGRWSTPARPSAWASTAPHRTRRASWVANCARHCSSRGWPATGRGR